jgi:hypothetical protein
VPKVGQGVNYVFGVVQLQEVLQVNQLNCPKPRLRLYKRMVKCYQVYKIYRLVTNTHQVDTRYTKVQDIQEI